MAETPPRPAQLERVLGPLDGLAILIGVVVGAGILGTPGPVAGWLGHPALILGIWVFGGVTVALVALTLAELGAMLPAAGGKYAYVRRAYGDGAGCFAGWAELLLNRSLTGAAKAALIGQYVVTLAGGRGSPTVVAGVVTLAFVALHARGVQAGRLVQNATTALKVALLVAIVGVGFAFGDGASWHASAAVTAPKGGLLLGLALATQAIFFTYYGSEASLQMSEEVRDPGRNVPRMLLYGAGSVTLIYLLVNIAFLNTLAPAAMGGSQLAARDVLARALGERAGTAVALVAIGILLSALNYNFFGTPRVPFGLARDGLAPRIFTRVNDRGTPAPALYLVSALIFVAAVSGSFEAIIRYMSFMTLVVDGFVLTSIFVLRRRAPDLPRPFRVPLYPLVPAAAIAAYAAMLTIIVVTQPKLAMGGGGLIALVAVASWIGTRRAGAREPALPVISTE